MKALNARSSSEQLLQHYEDFSFHRDLLTAHPVSKAVSNAWNEGEELIEPLTEAA